MSRVPLCSSGVGNGREPRRFQFAFARTMDGYRVLDLVGEGSFGKVRGCGAEKRANGWMDTC